MADDFFDFKLTPVIQKHMLWERTEAVIWNLANLERNGAQAMSSYTEQARKDPMFLRNQFPSEGRYDIPIIHRQDITWEGSEVIGLHNATANDPDAHLKAVHCFKDDARIRKAYSAPEKTLGKLRQYACLFTPNYSFFSNMPIALQIEAVFRSRWVGACWQSEGMQVVANASWGMPDSYDFCFDGLEPGSVVVVSTMGADRTKDGFLTGYFTMLERVQPSQVWCYCKPFPEMEGTVTRAFPYEAERKAKHGMQCRGQMSFAIHTKDEDAR